MVLTGTYSRNLDDKHRLAVPKRLREDIGDADLQFLYVAPGTEHSLVLYSPEAFEHMAAKLEEKASSGSDVRSYRRLFYGQAEKVDLDAQSRIRLPERLVHFAELERDVVLLGVHDHVELWNQRLWKDFVATSGPDFDQLAASVFES